MNADGVSSLWKGAGSTLWKGEESGLWKWAGSGLWKGAGSGLFVGELPVCLLDVLCRHSVLSVRAPWGRFSLESFPSSCFSTLAEI